MYKATLLATLLLAPFQAQAQPAAPTLYVNTEGPALQGNRIKNHLTFYCK